MLRLCKEAEEDVRSAYKWYENQKDNLGRAFLIEIDRMLAAVEEQPEAYPECFKDVRRALCKGFPYAIYYLRKNSDIVILAVLHQRRNPGLPRRRKSDTEKR